MPVDVLTTAAAPSEWSRRSPVISSLSKHQCDIMLLILQLLLRVVSKEVFTPVISSISKHQCDIRLLIQQLLLPSGLEGGLYSCHFFSLKTSM